MTRKLSARQLLAICVLGAASIVAASSELPAAAAAQPKKVSPPSELWNSYPLGKPLHAAKRPGRAAPVSTRTAPRNRAASGAALKNGSQLPKGLFASVLAAVLLAATAIMFARRLVPLRAGGGRRRGKPAEEAVPAPAQDDLFDALRPATKLEFRQYSPVANGVAPIPFPARLPEVPDGSNAPSVEVPDCSNASSIEHSELTMWRGYVKCELYAAVAGSTDAWAVSPPFRLRGETPNAAALQALAALLAELEESGWEVVSSGPGWYERRLERSARNPDWDSAA